MKKFVIILALIGFVFKSQGQTSYKDEVWLFPLKDNTIIAVNGERKALEAMFVCNKTAQIEILSGKISIFTVGGEEVSINAGTSFHVKKTRSSKKNVPAGQVSKYLSTPSTYLPNLYSDSRGEFKAFPVQSKVLDKSNLTLYFSEELPSGATLKIFLEDTNSLIWEAKNLSNKLICENIPIKKGKKYCWKIYNGSNSLKGNFALVDKKHEYFKLGAKSSKIEYLNTFFKLLEEEYLFDAIAVLLKAHKKFPESEILKCLLRKFSCVID